MSNVFSINKQHIYENKILQILAQFSKRTLKYSLNTKWAASSKVLLSSGHENILCNQRACNKHSNLSNICRGWRKNVTLTKGTRCANKHDRAKLKHRTANRCKTHHSFLLCPVFRSLGYLSFPLPPFCKNISTGVTSKTQFGWQIPDGVSPGNFLGQLNTLLFQVL